MVRRFLQAYAADAQGTTAIEYSVIAGGIALAIIVAVELLGISVAGLYAQVVAVFS